MSERESQFKSLRAKSISERLSEAEIAEVVRELVDPDSTVNKFVLLLTLGNTSAREYAHEVERFFDRRYGTDVARMALFVLIVDWGLGEHYREQLIESLRGLAWDTEDDVRVSATSCAGFYLRDHKDPEVTQTLLSLATGPSTDRVVVASAIYALGEGLGESWARMGFSLNVLEEKTLIDRVLTKSKDLLRDV